MYRLMGSASRMEGKPTGHGKLNEAMGECRKKPFFLVSPA
jgi:hypothetical protein